MSKKMSEEEKKDWDELYEYVRSKIMCYDKTQSLSKQMVLRLKGLLSGKFIANNKIKDKADYSYKTILMTFKACKIKIDTAMAKKEFNSEISKFNYICAIVENNLNDVYLRMKNIKRAEEDLKNIDFAAATNTRKAPYQRKTKECPKKYDEFW